MQPGCPELEKLDEFAADPSLTDAPVRDHISGCSDCLDRLAELSKNYALIEELGDVAAGLSAKLGPAAAPPNQIGEFDIVREIGRGGMGVVYEARQRNPSRRVALKVLRREYAASEERIRLFDREIRALARLRHVGIPAIYESGASADGPYYAMEFIEGSSLGEYLRRNAPGLEQRLRIFLQLCSAISFAHQHGVIHRDLKPGNVLVEEGGTPRVLDFGLARFTDIDVTSASLAMDTGRIVGTLAYMSPEQTRAIAEEIDLRSDVYSLGVILFEMLTGSLPYEVSRTSVPMAVKSICDSPARRPSSAAKNKSNAQMLTGDLDTILLKTLEKSPENRYQSAAALSEDIERYLSKQPIVARPPCAIYQLKKFAQRNRVLVGGVIAVMVALGAGIITTAWQAYRAREAERNAVAEAATSSEINRFLTTMFSAVQPGVAGPDVKVVEILKKAAAEIDRSFVEQPRVALALRDVIGRAYQGLSLYSEAEPQFREALKLAQAILGPEARQTLKLQYNLGESMLHNNQAEKAYEDLLKTLDSQSRVFGTHDRDTLKSKHFVAVIEIEMGRLEKGEIMLREVLAGRIKSLGPEDVETLESYSNLGLLLSRMGKFEESDELARKTYDIAKRVLGPDDPQTILYAGYVAMTARTPAQYEAVEPLFRDIVERASRVYGPAHQVTISFLGSLSFLLELRCKYEESESVAIDVYERLKAAFGERDPRVIAAMKPIGHSRTLSSKWTESEEITRRMVALSGEMYGDKAAQTVDAQYELLHVLNSSGKHEEGLNLASKIIAHRIELEGEKSTGVALAKNLMSEVLQKMGRTEEASRAANEALAALRSLPGTDPILIGWAERNVGVCLRDQGRFAEAEKMLLSGFDKLGAGVAECHPTCIETIDHIRKLYQLWHVADPDGGHDRQAAEFNARHMIPMP